MLIYVKKKKKKLFTDRRTDRHTDGQPKTIVRKLTKDIFCKKMHTFECFTSETNLKAQFLKVSPVFHRCPGVEPFDQKFFFFKHLRNMFLFDLSKKKKFKVTIDKGLKNLNYLSIH